MHSPVKLANSDLKREETTDRGYDWTPKGVKFGADSHEERVSAKAHRFGTSITPNSETGMIQ